MEDSREDKCGNPGADRYCDTDFAFGQKSPGLLAVWNRHFAIVLDHAHHIIAKFAEISRHCIFAFKRLAVHDEPLFHAAFMQHLFVSRANVGRQFGRTGIFLAVIPNLALQREAHC